MEVNQSTHPGLQWNVWLQGKPHNAWHSKTRMTSPRKLRCYSQKTAKDHRIREGELLLRWISKPCCNPILRLLLEAVKSKIMDVFLGFAVVPFNKFNKFPVPRDTRGSLPWCSINLCWLCWAGPLWVQPLLPWLKTGWSSQTAFGAECPSEAGDKSNAIYYVLSPKKN